MRRSPERSVKEYLADLCPVEIELEETTVQRAKTPVQGPDLARGRSDNHMGDPTGGFLHPLRLLAVGLAIAPFVVLELVLAGLDVADPSRADDPLSSHPGSDLDT